MNIGFIGVGRIGRLMAQHVLDAVYDLFVNDLNRESAQPLLEKGARWVESPKLIAQLCPVVLTCLPGPPEVEAVVYGDNGLMAGWKEGDIYVDMSTNSPTTVRRVAADAKLKGVSVLDAPVSGGIQGAEAATLSIIVGGDAQCLERVRQILAVIGKNIFHVGDVGCGNIAKIVNNMISAGCNAITAECMVLGVKAGIDPQKLYEVIRTSSGNNYWIERYYSTLIFKGNFEPGFRINLALKDIGLARALGNEYGISLPVSDIVEQKYLEAKAAGLGEKGTAAIILPLEESAGVKVRSTA